MPYLGRTEVDGHVERLYVPYFEKKRSRRSRKEAVRARFFEKNKLTVT